MTKCCFFRIPIERKLRSVMKSFEALQKHFFFKQCFVSQCSFKGILTELQNFQRIEACFVNCAQFLSDCLSLPHIGPFPFSLHLIRMPTQLCSFCQHSGAEGQGVLHYLDTTLLVAAHHIRRVPPAFFLAAVTPFLHEMKVFSSVRTVWKRIKRRKKKKRSGTVQWEIK